MHAQDGGARSLPNSLNIDSVKDVISSKPPEVALAVLRSSSKRIFVSRGGPVKFRRPLERLKLLPIPILVPALKALVADIFVSVVYA
jgi:hypothetical protein